MNEARKHAAVAGDRQPRIPGVAAAPVYDPSEHEFQLVVIEAARTFGYLVAHFRLVKDHRRGWITPAAADGVGWPDLEIVGRGRILHRELKSRRGRVRPEQQRWGDWINTNGGSWDVWRPQDWPERIISELGGKVAA
jgi:hypothetical protein